MARNENTNDAQEYNFWNELKKNIQLQDKKLNYFPKEGEVWMSYFGKNVGFEQNGGGNNFSRPILVIKKFNNHMLWGIPLSTKQKPFDFYYDFEDTNHRPVSLILAQLKLMSVKRLRRKLYDISPEDFLIVKGKLRTFLA